MNIQDKKTEYFVNENTKNDTVVTSSRVLYTASAFARDSLIHLQETGTLKAKKPHTSKREGLSSYLFMTVLEGEGLLYYGKKEYRLKKGDSVFIDCRHGYSHSTGEASLPDTGTDKNGENLESISGGHKKGKLWTLKWVHFNGSNMPPIYDKYLSRGGRCFFKSEKTDRYIDLLDRIYELAISSSYIRDMEINTALSSLLALLMEDGWNPDNAYSKGKRSELSEIKKYLDEHFTEKILLEDLSDRFFINRTYLAEIFKEQFGIPVNEYLIIQRITKSKELLRFSKKNLDEIAEECGFNTAAYYSRMFKRIEGVSPGEYKKLW